MKIEEVREFTTLHHKMISQLHEITNLHGVIIRDFEYRYGKSPIGKHEIIAIVGNSHIDDDMIPVYIVSVT
jgi:hypothetical protein